MNRAEHLQWAKDRALTYVDDGDYVNAVASFMSDLSKHPDTESQATNPALAGLGLMAAASGDREEVVKFINGTN